MANALFQLNGRRVKSNEHIYKLGKQSEKNNMKIGVNFAVFILFFGIALVEALQSQNWLLASLVLLVGLVFLYGDNKRIH